MPPPGRQSLPNDSSVLRRIQRPLCLMARHITVEAGSDDVRFDVPTAIAPRIEVLGGALKPLGQAARNSKLRHK